MTTSDSRSTSNAIQWLPLVLAILTIVGAAVAAVNLIEDTIANRLSPHEEGLIRQRSKIDQMDTLILQLSERVATLEERTKGR